MRLFLRADGRMLFWTGLKGTLMEVKLHEGAISFEIILQTAPNLATFFIGEDRNQRFFLGTGDGLWMYDQGDRLKHYFKGESIYYVFLDREGNHWVSVKPWKLFLIKNIEALVFDKRENTLPNTLIEQIEILDTNRIAVRTFNAYVGIGNKDSIQFTQFQKDAYNQESFTFIEDELNWFVPETRPPSPTKLYSLTGGKPQAHNQYIIPNGVQRLIYVNDTLGFARTADHQFARIRFQNGRGKLEKVFAPTIRLIQIFPEDDTENVWITGFRGLYRWQSDSLYDMGHYLTKGLHPRYVKQQNDSMIWVVNYFDGVHLFKKKKDQSYTYEGLKCHVTNGQMLDIVGDNMFVGTRVGLYKYDMRDSVVKKYGAQHGLTFEDISIVKRFKDDLWIGTTDGLQILPLHNNDVRVPPAVPPKMRIKRIAIQGRDTTLQHSFSLPHDQNELSFELQAFSFRGGNTYSYEHRMLGIDTAWKSSPATSNLITYYDLRPGNFQFQVRVKDRTGMYSESTSEIRLTIIPPYWETIWFQALKGLGIAVLAGLLCGLYF
ncbi:MAG: triple tyrosine motif-containing protein, partial [Bacteroidota bacterium]